MLALSIHLYGSEIWMIRQKDILRLKTMKINLFRGTAGYILLDQKINEEIFEELGVESVEIKIQR